MSTNKITAINATANSNVSELNDSDLAGIQGGYATSTVTINGKTTTKVDPNANGASSYASASSDGSFFSDTFFS
jgi:hypothetical protein